MPLCNATKRNGQPCTFNAKPNTDRCGHHPLPNNEAGHPPVRARVRVIVPDEHRCTYITFNGRGNRCASRKSPQSNRNECLNHYTRRANRERFLAAQAAFRQMWEVHGTAIIEQLAVAADAAAAADGIHPHQRLNIAHMYARSAVWRMVRDGEEEAVAIVNILPVMIAFMGRVNEAIRRRGAADTRPDLQRIADDNQNTHNRDVRRQTDENVKLLMEISPPAGQKTMEEIREMWAMIYRIPGRGVDERVYTDMQRWYDTPQCYAPNDWKYRKVLDALWYRIKLTEDIKIRSELCKRLQQECAESFMMCCEGHIGRLANVLVGFDDAFRPQIPIGIILQQKMAIIAQIENMDERFKQARELMSELNVPQEQAVPWLDAIAE